MWKPADCAVHADEFGGGVMAKVIGHGEISGSVTLVLTEAEAKALDALVGYGVAPFLEAFYKHLGKAYLQPYEQGLKSLFESVRTGEGSVSNFLKRIHDAREVFTGKKNAYVPPEHRAANEPEAF
jgi:hypothetical protein